MKSKLFIFTILFFSQKLMAQFTVAQPELFNLANNSYFPCPVSDIGKIFYATNANAVWYCTGDFTIMPAGSYWEGGLDTYYMGKVAINKSEASYELDVLGQAKFNLLSVDGKVGINTTTPTEKLELVNRDIFIRSTADEYVWALNYIGTAGRLDFRGQGLSRMYINNVGNISIGSPASSNKLNVEGDVSYAGSLLIEGKGILSNSNASQLKMHIFTSELTPANFNIGNNTCSTISFTFVGNIFTQAPVVVLGQKIAGFSNDAKLVMSIENVTTSVGFIRMCNNSGANVPLQEVRFTLMAVGQ